MASMSKRMRQTRYRRTAVTSSKSFTNGARLSRAFERRPQVRHRLRIDEPRRRTDARSAKLLRSAKCVDGGDDVWRVVVRAGCARVERRVVRLVQAERLEHDLELPHVAAAELLQRSIAERLRDRVVDASHLGDGIRILANGDVRRHAVGSTRAARPRIGDDDGGGLSEPVALVAAERVARGDGVDEPVGEMSRLAFARLEALRDRFDHFRTDEDVALRDVVGARRDDRPTAAAACPCAAPSDP